MPKFLVIVHAGTFLIDLQGEIEARGAFTGRVVKAASEGEAIGVAIKSVRREVDNPNFIVRDESHVPTFEAFRVKQVSSLRRVRAVGLAMYDPADAETRSQALAAVRKAIGFRSD